MTVACAATAAPFEPVVRGDDCEPEFGESWHSPPSTAASLRHRNRTADFSVDDLTLSIERFNSSTQSRLRIVAVHCVRTSNVAASLLRRSRYLMGPTSAPILIGELPRLRVRTRQSLQKTPKSGMERSLGLARSSVSGTLTESSADTVVSLQS